MFEEFLRTSANVLPQSRRVLIKLEVDGKPRYEAFGSMGFFGESVDWQGTLRNTEFKTQQLSMGNLPKRLTDTVSTIEACANRQYAGRNVQIKN